MTIVPNKKYDLEERTLKFSREIRQFVHLLPKTLSNREDIRQLVRSSGSIGANYIEASESLGVKDFYMRMRIARKEAKESIYWLQLLEIGDEAETNEKKNILIQEGTELMRIFGSIVSKSSK